MAVAGKKPRRKSKSAAIYIFIAALLIIILAVLGISVFLKIIEIEVNGASLYSKEAIIAASGISIGDNILFMDTKGASQNISAIMPYINEVNIEISLPDTIMIYISETKPFAAVKYPGGALMIDKMGRILEQSDIAPDDLIEIRGFTPTSPVVGNALQAESGDDTRLGLLNEVLAAIEREGIQNDVSYLDVSNIAYISFGYRGRFRVILGRGDYLRDKLSSLDEMIADIDESEENDVTGTINMSDRERWRWTPDR